MKNLTFIWGVLLLLAGCQSPQTPSSLFMDNGYRSDTVYVSGQVLNFPKDKSLQIYYTDFVKGGQTSLKLKPDSLGNFRMCVPVINSTSLLLADFMLDGVLSLIAEPGEQVGIRADWEKKTLAFEGEHSKAHQDVYDYNRYVNALQLPYVHIDAMDRKLTHEAFLDGVLAEWSKKDSLLNDYMQTHPQMSPRAIQELQITYFNRFATDLMQRRFELDSQTKEAFPESYMQKVDSIFRMCPRPYTLTSATFLCDYLDYYNERKAIVAPTMKMMLDYLNAEKGITLTEAQQQDMTYLRSPEMRELLGEAYKALASSPAYEAALIDQYCGGLDIVSVPSDLKELMIAYYHHWCLDGMRKPLAEANVERFRSLVKNPDIARPVLELQQKYEEIARRAMESTASLMTNEHLEDCQTGEALLAGILKPYKGKLVFVDVWGTWCSPCKEEMKHGPAIVQAMKGEEVVFLYLANRSPKASWENVIKEYGLTGGQMVHYNLPEAQQDMLERHLQVKYYPSYFLIDREGNIVDNDPPKPSSGDKLIGYLKDWLKR